MACCVSFGKVYMHTHTHTHIHTYTHTHTHTHTHSFSLSLSLSLTHTHTQGSVLYVVDIQAMTQTNLSSGFTRNLRTVYWETQTHGGGGDWKR
jgi:hypothetical protein